MHSKHDTSGGYEPREQDVVENPYGFYDRWLRGDAVVYSESLGSYLVTRDKDCRHVCLNHRVFSNRVGTDKGLGEDDGCLVSADEPLQAKQKKIVNHGFCDPKSPGTRAIHRRPGG